MKDKVLFFVLGAVLATVAYFAGDMDKADAQGDRKVFEGDVVINGKLIVQGGQMIVYKSPGSTGDLGNVGGYVSSAGTQEFSSIDIKSGPYDENIGKSPSWMTLSAVNIGNGFAYSRIVLFDNYGNKADWIKVR